jgi:hypothetical protein
MEAATRIRAAVGRISALRELQFANPPLRAAALTIKALQARRFAGTYADALPGVRTHRLRAFFLKSSTATRTSASETLNSPALRARLNDCFQSKWPNWPCRWPACTP